MCTWSTRSLSSEEGEKLEFGIDLEEFRGKMGPSASDSDWGLPHEVSCQRRSDGAIIIGSLPTGLRSDLMMGQRMEVWLFPDGRYWARINGNWLPHLPQWKREGRPPGFVPGKDGCEWHASCFECPEPDCILPEGQ